MRVRLVAIDGLDYTTKTIVEVDVDTTASDLDELAADFYWEQVGGGYSWELLAEGAEDE